MTQDVRSEPPSKEELFELCLTRLNDATSKDGATSGALITTTDNQVLAWGVDNVPNVLKVRGKTDPGLVIPAEIQAILKLARSGHTRQAYRLYIVPTLLRPSSASIVIALGIGEVVTSEAVSPDEKDRFITTRHLLETAGVNVVIVPRRGY